ncbi:MAG: hypothetical protein CR982_10540 [Candidatus Cloacimonadota bacterium]|nr:MAG: hypothetical protein CR982_10540 [Candidatus Cloacimonadota bacterium]PIE78642.1 MAG: hypothetical protein CSA15_07090 [Candidatus Delongbacteria bacterium]
MVIKSYKLTFDSFLISEIHSDTIMGHICWAIKYIYGESFLEEFLEIYKSSKKENDYPFIFSSIFPYLHYPIVAQPLKFEIKSKNDYKYAKKVKKVKYLRNDLYSNCNVKLFLNNGLGEAIFNQIKDGEKFTSDHYTKETIHNMISRESSKTEKNSLFLREKKIPIVKQFWFFVKVGDNEEKWLKVLDRCLKFLEVKGVGGDTSIGGGIVSITEIDHKIDDDFNSENPNCYISLSHCVSSKPMFYNLITKYGKVYSKLEKNDEPFKQPIFLMEPGAIIEKIEDYNFSESIITNIHSNEKVLHIAIPFLMPITLKLN